MTTATAPETTTQYSLDNPPPGFKWDWDEVKGDHGQLSFGQRPLLTALESEEGAKGLLAFYGNDGICRIYNARRKVGTRIRSMPPALRSN
jgi:hypothetical protein